MNCDSNIGDRRNMQDMLRVNELTLIPKCTFTNQVLYVINEFGRVYLDLHDSDVRWFVCSSDVWESKYDHK